MQYNNLTSIQYPSLDLLPHASRWKCGQTKKSTLPHHCGKVDFLKEKAGTYLFSQVVSNQLSSARQSLTSVFGMGTGGPSPLKTPTIFRNCTLKTKQRRVKARGLPAKYRSSPRVISTSRLNTLLRLHRWPINEVVFFDPYSIMDGRSYLRGSFTLRCLQRLSRPDVATQLCRWHDNWCTRGLSIPVLSY